MGPEHVPRLKPLTPAFTATVAALRLVAQQIVAPARKPDNEIALIATPGGFGTPEFEHGGIRHQVRVEDGDLVHRAGARERRAPLTTLEDARHLVAELLPAEPLDDAPVGVDAAAARGLAAWYAFGDAALRDLTATAGAADAPTPAWIWPEHFDIAVDLGSEAAGRRATYGFSPGDDRHPEPYAYVAPWTAQVDGDLWRADGFRGAELPYRALAAADDQRAVALDFFITRRDALA